MTDKKNDQLSSYEEGIVENLIEEFDFEPGVAAEIVRKYRRVIELLGGYDDCYDHAERLTYAYRNHMNPKEWENRLKQVIKNERTDVGFTPQIKAYATAR